MFIKIILSSWHRQLKSGLFELCSNGNGLGWLPCIALVSAVFTFFQPTTAFALPTAANITSGGRTTCALLSDRSVECWGNGSGGGIGSGFAKDSNANPTAVAGLNSGVLTLASGMNHACVVTTKGLVLCWGNGGYGRLGNGSEATQYAPVAVDGLSSAVATVVVGWYHTCALLTDGKAWCWGLNADGQLGIGRPGYGENGLTSSLKPVAVSGLTQRIMSIAAGTNHTCALLEDASVACWGDNTKGQLGNNSSAGTTSPVAVVGLSGAVKGLAVGDESNCAVMTAGGVECWGSNGYGTVALDAGSSSVIRTPVKVLGLDAAAVTIAIANSQACALIANGKVQCWGLNSTDQISALQTRIYVPTTVTGLPTGVRAIALGNQHGCALFVSDAVWCWGYNYDGALGRSDASFSSYLPAPVVGLGLAASDPDRTVIVEYYYQPLDYYFITSRATDIAALNVVPGWIRSGIPFPVYKSLPTNALPTNALSINRYYFDKIALNKTRGSHFYTLVKAEKDLLAAQNPSNIAAPQLPYNEGIDSYAFAPAVEGVGGGCASDRNPVYRLFRGQVSFPDNPNHRFTDDRATYENYVKLGWTGEGVKICVPRR